MPVPQSQKNLARLLVHGGVGIGLVGLLDDQDATHNVNPEERARTKRRLQAQLDEAGRTRATYSLGRSARPTGDSPVPAASRGLPAADWSATRRRFHGYRGHAPPRSTALSPPSGAAAPGYWSVLGEGRAASDTILAPFQPRLWAPGSLPGCAAWKVRQF